MNISEQTSFRQRLQAVQIELIEGFGSELGEAVTSALGRLVHTLDWLRLAECQRPWHSQSQRPNHPQKHLHEPAQSSQ
jgi:hypothetical protein